MTNPRPKRRNSRWGASPVKRISVPISLDKLNLLEQIAAGEKRSVASVARTALEAHALVKAETILRD